MFLAALLSLASPTAPASTPSTPHIPSTIELLGSASIPASATDLSGLTELLAGEFPHNRLGSFGSGIDSLNRDNLYIACNDRGPLDGATRFRPRIQTLRILINPASAQPVEVHHIATTLLSDESSQPFTGFYGRFDEADQTKGLRLDPEGIRAEPDGSFWLADEYGPWIDQYSAAGTRTRRIPIPDKFIIETPSQDPTRELPPTSTKGRQANRGFEGLARSPDGSKLWAILQSPLIQDNALDERAKRAGLNIRILEITIKGPKAGTTRELVYQLEKASNGVSEILALSDNQLLVIERDGEFAREAVWRRLYTINISTASDVSAIDSLPREDLPPEITPVTKAKFLDFCDERFNLVGKHMPEKIEGLALGPTLADGRRTLIVTVDNDLREDVDNIFWVFAWKP